MDSKRKYTIADVANKLGVSSATVSRALSGSPGVGVELREKILAFTKEIGYKPNQLASGLRKGKSNIIGLVFGDARNPFYSELIFYIQQKLEQNGYMVMIFNSNNNLAKEITFLEISRNLCLAGLILLTAQSNMRADQLNEADIPIVLVNRLLEVQNYDSVLTDNFKAGYIAAMHLIELGHRRIGFVNGEEESSSCIQRFEGVKQALKSYFLPLMREDVFSGDLGKKKGHELAKVFLKRDSRPSALVIADDITALGFLDQCRANGVAVPEELSIISFDNIAFSSMHGVDLTTISQHIEEMGNKAVELMLRRIENPAAKYKRIIMEPTLVVRNTTKTYE